MQAHGQITKHWLADILVVRTRGALNREGIVRIREELSQYVLASGKPSWRRLTLLSPDTFGPPEIYSEIEEMYRWDQSHGCYAVAVVINNHLQAKLVSDLRANNDFNMQIFTDKHLALGWLDQQNQVQGMAPAPAAMPAHGHAELSWQGDILNVQVQGPFNVEGLHRALDELKRCIAAANKRYWFRLVELDDNSMGSPEVYEAVAELHQWTKDNGCLATAMLTSSAVQTGLLNKLGHDHQFNIQVFASKGAAIDWIDQQRIIHR